MVKEKAFRLARVGTVGRFPPQLEQISTRLVTAREARTDCEVFWSLGSAESKPSGRQRAGETDRESAAAREERVAEAETTKKFAVYLHLVFQIGN